MNIPEQQVRPLLRTMMDALREYFFPDYTDTPLQESRQTALLALEKICGEKTALGFSESMPGLAALLNQDVEALAGNDPSAAGIQEIIYCYPAVTAMMHFRTAHELDRLGVAIIPRMLTEWAHSMTGIDIHPQATIGHHFAIDHGTGVVIGQTAIIGNYVTMYQGVTIGAKNIRKGSDGTPCNIPRHPIIEDNVTIYSNATLLGRITIGRDSVIGGNVWLTESVPPGSKIIQK